jgi:urea transport system substrate-binding protein
VTIGLVVAECLDAWPNLCFEREPRVMRRWLVGSIVLIVIGGVFLWRAPDVLWRVERPILVGILHSKTGPMAIIEQAMIDAEVLALEEINAQGGLLGRPVKWVIADGRSHLPTFALEARRLIESEKVSVIFGCMASASRKTVKPIVEQYHHLLFYPNAYEGLEQSPNIVYTGAAPNQHIIPAVKWTYDHLKARRYFLAGSDHIWPQGVNAIVKDCLTSLGAEVVGEEYLLLESSDVDPLIAKIKEAKPDVILSTVTGNTNLAFYPKLVAAGLGPERLPVVAFGVAEVDLRQFPVRDMVGDYASWNYFQSIDRPENQEFVRKFKAKYGTDAVVSDAIDMAYNSVKLWAQAVEEGQTDDVATVQKLIARQSLSAAEGIISVDPETRHTWRPVSIGRIRRDGQFEIVWTSDKPVRPVPYPSSRTREEWDVFIDALFRRWDGNWANPGKEKSSAVATAG